MVYDFMAFVAVMMAAFVLLAMSVINFITLVVLMPNKIYNCCGSSSMPNVSQIETKPRRRHDKNRTMKRPCPKSNSSGGSRDASALQIVGSAIPPTCSPGNARASLIWPVLQIQNKLTKLYGLMETFQKWLTNSYLIFKSLFFFMRMTLFVFQSIS